MGRSEVTIVREIGKLSDSNYPKELTIADYDGVEKYDIRKWVPQASRGIRISKDKIVDFLDILIVARESDKTDSPIFTTYIKGKKVYIYSNYGCYDKYRTRGEDYYWTVTYTLWGESKKYDIRPWTKDYSQGSYGLRIDETELDNLINLLKQELGIDNTDNFCDDEVCFIDYQDFLVRSNITKCVKNHELKPIRAMINVVRWTGDITTEIISACYCKDCKHYFILDLEYEDLKKQRRTFVSYNK